MGLFDTVAKFKGQDYKALKKEAKVRGRLFVDPEFPPEDRSLSATPGKHGNVVWKRPKEMVAKPRLFVDGVDKDDVRQGDLGNCWFVAALSCLTSVKQYWHKVIPDYKDQDWNEEKPEEYQGIFRFLFWRTGQWTEVVVDDLLPTVNGQLVFIRSKTGQEFWSALLEKAYAKIYGSYEALDGGRLTEALEDFTGGVSASLDLVEMKLESDHVARTSLFDRLEKEMDRNTLMGASIPAKSTEEMEATAPKGLVKGHAYGITAVRHVSLKGSGLFSFFNREKIQMIRCRNPWGSKEWTGAFSDGSAEWDRITDSDKKKMGLTKEEDGEFWMTWEDFCQNFQRVDLCSLVNTSILSISKTWHEGLGHGAWTAPTRAGGCSNHPTFLNNPQYAFDVSDDDEEMMIQLMQKNTRDSGGSSHKTIGFRILRVEMNREYRVHDAELHDVVPSNMAFTDTRSLFARHTDVKKGRYVIIPSTFEPNLTGDFLLRIYTSSSNHFKELTKEVPTPGLFSCCSKKPKVVTSVKVVKAAGLQKLDKHGGADPYCVLVCEGSKVKTRVLDNTLSPSWGDSALFYRKHLNKPITIQVWNSNLLRDEFMGQHELKPTGEQKLKSFECGLFGRDKEKALRKAGKLLVTVTQSGDLTAV
ncbi:calpain-5-like [Babylonia areolata]|uniref:calpain-5-like n=1 Tax=Babylonia areolata TaxID=304850 RepID=UPI003FD26F35